MCNLYILYYTDAKNGQSYMDCMNNDGSINSTDYFPINSDEPLPPNPLLEEHAIGSGHRTQTVSNKTDLNLVSYHACSCYSQLLVYWRSLLSFSLLFYRPFVLSFFNFRVYLSWRFSLALALFFFFSPIYLFIAVLEQYVCLSMRFILFYFSLYLWEGFCSCPGFKIFFYCL